MNAGLIDALATMPADRVLFRSGSGTVTAGQVRAGARIAAGQIDRQADRIALHTRSLSGFAVGLLSAAMVGKSVACPAHCAATYLAEIGVDDRCPLLSDDETGRGRRVYVAPARQADESTIPLTVQVDRGITFFTSGATGTPKAVPKTYRQLDLEARSLNALWGADARRAIIATVSHQHIYGMLFRLFWPVLAADLSADVALEHWEELAPTLVPGCVLVTSPAHLTRLPPTFRGRPDLVFSSGAPLPPAAVATAHDALGRWPIEVLGSTETGGVAWRTQEVPNDLWTPIPGVTVTAEQGPDRGLMVSSAHADPNCAVALGDAGVVSPDGRFRLEDRLDRIVKVEGVRVSLPRVESILASLPEIDEAAAVSLPDQKGWIGAVLVLSEPGRNRLAELGTFRLGRALRTALAGSLAPGERPKRWRFVDRIPENAQGKRPVSTLRSLFAHAGMVDPEQWITSLVVADDAATVELRLEDDMPWFEGHFPGEPILPGIAQVHLAVLIASRIWDWQTAGANLSRIKFQHVLRPRDVVTLTLRRDPAEGHLTFQYSLPGRAASSGIVGGRG